MGRGRAAVNVPLTNDGDGLQARGYLSETAQLRIDERAHVILPVHRALDAAREKGAGATFHLQA